ncbi:MAG: hypothetical protein QM817_22350 [Archangium sp.]
MTKPTTIRLDGKLKKRIEKLAAELDQSAHSLMLEGIERVVVMAEERLELLREAERRSAKFARTRKGLPFEDVKSWLDDLAAGKRRALPKARRLPE